MCRVFIDHGVVKTAYLSMEPSVRYRLCLSACFKFGTHDDLKVPGGAEIKYELAWVAPPL